tara:strand:- start:89 stop:1411 length:1323 start_codon:yes stop_codon:yes gene_type:complete
MSVLLKTPKSIKETRVAEPPKDGYDAYLYQYTNLDNGKIYVGIHKGDYNDGYTNSSTNEEFNEALANPNSNFRYEVKEYGSYSLMTVRENDILSIGRSLNKDMYYNKTNGAPQFKVPDFDAVDLLINKVKTGHYPVTQMSREDLQELQFIQVRTEEHSELKKDIAQSIDEAAGDTSKCEPIVIFEGRGLHGDDIGGDGNHTHQGGMLSKKMRSMPVIVVPFKDNKHYSNVELRTFSNEMNSPQEVHKNPASKEDLKKQLLNMIVDAQDKSVLDEPSVKGWLVNKMHLTKKKAGGLILSAKAQWDKDQGVEADKYFRTYSDSEFELHIRKYERGNPESIVIGINSNFVKYDQIMRDLEVNLLRDKDGKLIRPIQAERPMVTFVVRHKSSTHVDRWEDVLSKNLKTWVYPYLSLLGMTPSIVVLPSQVSSDFGILRFTKEAA